uniref:Uncharacterized protein n=1 Tax=Anguilla anguilla TaxID=7936 RepID=A0A0E9TXY2_ANGAN
MLYYNSCLGKASSTISEARKSFHFFFIYLMDCPVSMVTSWTFKP